MQSSRQACRWLGVCMASEALLWVLWCCLCHSRAPLRTQQLSFLPEVQGFSSASLCVFPSSLSICTLWSSALCVHTDNRGGRGGGGRVSVSCPLQGSLWFLSRELTQNSRETPAGKGEEEEEGEQEGGFCCLRGEQQEVVRIFVQHTHVPLSS